MYFRRPSEKVSLSTPHRNAITPQAAKNVCASQDALFEIFGRLEAFFQRLEIYTEAALDQNMVDTVTKIMVEVLNIIGIATIEIKQGRMKKYLNKLFGNRSDISRTTVSSLTVPRPSSISLRLRQAGHHISRQRAC